ncbi:hypothetical protein C5167_008210 [Papaver somniferum]|uniref:Factor of DNA methylation 1-5/IDN2 domain-containing protein n=1 Tax=Papaver somniferum TaxID=3469 RepID=A0A4Y7JWT3_PAPSO|nr:hypothetical protein C5167_008210 [Papaver somniferum]
MKGRLEALKHVAGADADCELKKNIKDLTERQGTNELQEARKELINQLREMGNGGAIGVKRMGGIDFKPFQDACKKKYSADEADVKASQLLSDWENELKDPNWYPF